MSKRLTHALHNEEVCDYLNNQSSFYDWVVTTAFYSSLHFIYHKIFPGSVPINGGLQECKDFAEYYNQIPRNIRSNQHLETINLVWQVTPIGSEYKQLFDLCHDARYKNYKVSEKQALLAREVLSVIKQHCNSQQAPEQKMEKNNSTAEV